MKVLLLNGGPHPQGCVATALEEIARVRACLLKGNELDISKAANILMDDFRNGRLGRITLEFAEDYK